jgi:hypothetical protein
MKLRCLFGGRSLGCSYWLLSPEMVRARQKPQPVGKSEMVLAVNSGNEPEPRPQPALSRHPILQISCTPFPIRGMRAVWANTYSLSIRSASSSSRNQVCPTIEAQPELHPARFYPLMISEHVDCRRRLSACGPLTQRSCPFPTQKGAKTRRNIFDSANLRSRCSTMAYLATSSQIDVQESSTQTPIGDDHRRLRLRPGNSPEIGR